ncbi:condensation domain-containing protein [Kitasatospora mediocidica]|uniref:condensation domain-containing protein n=1 Tax=Kitasatospora mediocidica TaxID=58352 RepID=UPI00068FB812|nr:condensation domain-containing protein [Kitasatospora mediocidica]
MSTSERHTERHTERDAERHTVRYAVEDSAQGRRVGPLTLGQDNMIRCIRLDDPSHMNKQAFWTVPEGARLPDVLGALRTLAERHEALRTVFPGPPGDQPELQEVLLEGEFTVQVVAAEPTDELGALTMELGRLGRARAFDLAAEFPLRPTLVTVQGRPVQLVVVICHAQLDGVATGLLYMEWLTLVAGGSLPPAQGRTPLEVAESEQSKGGQRRAKAALRHWERILRCSPQAVFADDRVGASDALLPTLLVRSTAAAEALERAERRTGTSASNVLLAAYVALVAQRADQRTVVVAALSSNRHRPGLGDHIGTLAQDALLSLETDAADFDELLGRVQAAALGGYWHSAFDAEKIWRMIDDTAHLRGARFARHVVVNDLSMTVPEEVAAAGCPVPAADPELTWLPKEILPTRIMLNIWRVRGCLELTLHADPQLFTVAETEHLVHGLLRLLDAAATGPLPLRELPALTGLVAGRRTGERWRRVDNSWIDLVATRALLESALDRRPCQVSLEEDRLTARIDIDGRPLTLQQVHAAVMAALPGRDTAMAPRHYVLHEGPRTLAEGSGRGGVTDWQALLG